MVKKYVSVLELMGEVITYLNEKEHTVQQPYLPDYHSIRSKNGPPFFIQDIVKRQPDWQEPISAHPLDRIAEQLRTKRSQETAPAEDQEEALPEALSAVLTEDEENRSKTDIGKSPLRAGTQYGIQQLRILRNVYPNMEPGQDMEVPYLLEYEYLKNSDFSLTDTEWKCVHQMMLFQLLAWYQQQTNYVTGHAITQNMFLELEAAGRVYHLDIEEHPEVVETLVKRAYKQYHPMETSYSSYVQKHFNRWYAAPKSSLDALEILEKNYGNAEKRVDEQLYEAMFLLHLPMIMVFSVLEQGTKKYKAYTYHDYYQYKKRIPDYIWRESSMDEVQIESLGFSYGYANVSCISFEEKADKHLIRKVMNHIFAKMKTLAADKNICTISVLSLGLLENDELEKASVLLNNHRLDWSQEEVDE